MKGRIRISGQRLFLSGTSVIVSPPLLVARGDPEPDATFIRMNGPIQDCGYPNEGGESCVPGLRDLALPQASLS